MPDLRRGEIWLANLNPRQGTEPGKTRPVLIVQAQALLDARHPSTFDHPPHDAARGNAEPLRVRVGIAGGLRQDSDLLMDQFRAIDNRRLVRGPLLLLSPDVMGRVDAALSEVLEWVRR